MRYASDIDLCPKCLVPLDWACLKTVFWTGVENCQDPTRYLSQSIDRIDYHGSQRYSSSVEGQSHLEPDILEARFNEILVQFQQVEISNRSLEAQEERIIIKLLELVEEIKFCERCIARQNSNM